VSRGKPISYAEDNNVYDENDENDEDINSFFGESATIPMNDSPATELQQSRVRSSSTLDLASS